MLQVASILFGYCICFHTYVASVFSICFFYFRRMLHSSVSCCTSFILFGESWGAGTENGHSELGAGGRGALGANGRGASVGWGKRSRIEADRACCECEMSPPNTRALRRDRMYMRGGKNQRMRAGCVGVWTCTSIMMSGR